MTLSARWSARIALAGAAAILAAAVPSVASAHGPVAVYASALPLGVYLVGAAAVVALSFAVVIARDVRAPTVLPGRPVRVPAALGAALRVVGLGGWAWVLGQGIAGGSDASVATLFLWVYGWIGVALVSALAFPVWEWLDPFATLFDVGAWLLRHLGVRGWTPSGVPPRVWLWPAVAGFAVFAWLRLVAVPGTGALTWSLAGYTALTLVLMAHAGRDEWRAGGETFTVWFRTLNRMAPFGLETSWQLEGHGGGSPPRLVRREFGAGLLSSRWSTPRIVLVALGVAAVLFDGVSQTGALATVLGSPGLLARSAELAAWGAVVVALSLLVARQVSPGAIGAGLLPVAVGYLAAHNLTYLLVEGQRMAVAVSDPLGTGADLFGTASYQVQSGWLPAGLVWTLQVAAVVGGHMVGAWAGHVAAQRDMEAGARPRRDLRHRKIHTADVRVVRNVRPREVPLAVVMVALSALTLWSLGQASVVEIAASGARAGAEAPPRAVARAAWSRPAARV